MKAKPLAKQAPRAPPSSLAARLQSADDTNMRNRQEAQTEIVSAHKYQRMASLLPPSLLRFFPFSFLVSSWLAMTINTMRCECALRTAHAMDETVQAHRPQKVTSTTSRRRVR